MKIGIVGLGVVGSAVKYGLEKLGHNVLSHDIALGTSIEDLLGSQIVFLCVPTPSNDDGSCNTSIVKEVIDELHKLEYSGIIAIKSTVSPGTTQSLIQKHNNNRICFVFNVFS